MAAPVRRPLCNQHEKRIFLDGSDLSGTPELPVAYTQAAREVPASIRFIRLAGYFMPYVVTEPCINCKYTDCVEVCPVDCFYEGPNFLAIQPDECIDCNACVPVCPVEAIYPDDQLPEEYEHYIQWNEYLANQWRELGYNITETSGPLDNAEEWEDADKSEQDILTWDV